MYRSRRKLLAACLVVLGLFVHAGGCRREPEQAKAGDAAQDAGPPTRPDGAAVGPRQAPKLGPPVTNVAVIVIDERNTDTFAKLLALPGRASGAVPFRLVGGQVALTEAVRDETDPLLLSAYGLRLGAADVPLSRCRVLVIHRIRYDGVGRKGETRRFHAFGDLPASVSLPAAPAGRYQFNPAASPSPFVMAIRGVRILGDKPSRIALRAGKDEGTIVAELAGVSKSLAKGASAELSSRTKAVRVTRKPLSRDAIIWKGPKPANLPAEIRPGRNYGRIDFTTKLEITNRGVRPVVEAAKPGGKEARP